MAGCECLKVRRTHADENLKTYNRELELIENRRGNSITLWDTRADLSGHAGLIYRWYGYSENNSAYSLLRYVEIHGERLRRKYLAWIHELGESRIHGKRLIDHLVLEDGLSYWWMTLFVEKNLWKSPSIIDAIRLLALEEIVVQQKPGKLRLVSVNRRLHEVLSGLCQNLGIAYEWERLPDQSRPGLSIRGIYRALPQSVTALISLARYLRIRWPLRQADKLGWFGGDRSLFFCSYFFHMVSKLAEEGHFHSRYWEGLHGLMGRLGLSGNWLQLYYPHDAVPNPRVAMDWVQRFNQQRLEQGFHSFLDAYLCWRIVLRVLRRWLKLTLISWHLSGIKHAFRPPGSQFSLWPLMRGDWHTSMRGPVAISNLLWIELFDRALHDLSHQKKGLYLCENQAWERALIHAWRKHRHGQLIAVEHSTVRFWDLRYFTDPRTVRSSDPYPMPQADLMALNGKAAVDAYLSVDYPKEAIVECEALRYGYLNDIRPWHSSRQAMEGPIRVLILGDFLPSGTIKMLQLLEAAVSHISVLATYTVKPHSNFMVKSEDYPSLHVKIVMDPLGEILHDYDIAYSGNMTAAAVDAYLVGLPVVVMLDETELNFSPLRGQSDVRFVSTPEELAEVFETASQGIATNPDRNEFFFLDPELSRWTRILSSAGVPSRK